MRTLVVAPHPDDEILGCGGTLLRRRAEGGELGWLIVTAISERSGWPVEAVQQREAEIENVAECVGFSKVFNLRRPTAKLDSVPLSELVEEFAVIFNTFRPEELLVPHRADVHSDHRVVFDVVSACSKWFRYPFVRRVLAYETLSETGFGLDARSHFRPNYYIDISGFLQWKLEAISVYRSELDCFPFPRSHEAIRAQAALHGANAGFYAAEAFELLRERH